jgi:hypothetical protein
MSLQEQATRRSGVKQEDAFAIDEVNLYQRLGLDTFIKLSTEFYTRYVNFVASMHFMKICIQFFCI